MLTFLCERNRNQVCMVGMLHFRDPTRIHCRQNFHKKSDKDVLLWHKESNNTKHYTKMFRGEVGNVSANQRPVRASCFPIGPKTNLVDHVEILHPVKFRWIQLSGFREEFENVSANQRPGWPSCFPIILTNKKLVERVTILLPVKFRWILFIGFRGEVDNVSANQRLGRAS